jgi:phenylalanyl-tRNA synthetase beta chain
VVAELDLTGLGGGVRRDVTAAPPPRYPASERDLAIVVKAAVPAGEIAAAIRASGGPTLANLRLFDVYRGNPLAPDEKSLAYRLTFRATDRTLEEAEVEAAIAAITAGLSAGIGARIRT